MTIDDTELEETTRQVNKRWLQGNVYVLDRGDGKHFKIGYTRKDVQQRRLEIIGTPAQRGVIFPDDNRERECMIVVESRVDTNAYYVEQILHMRLDDLHVVGEWFDLSDWISLVDTVRIMCELGSVELHDRWFELIPNDLEKFIEHGLAPEPGTYPYYLYYDREAKHRASDEFFDFIARLHGKEGEDRDRWQHGNLA